jgi:hypothetical protein
MERRWNDTEGGKTEELEENLSECHFAHNSPYRAVNTLRLGYKNQSGYAA